MKKIYLFIGTTAELIKLAPVISELNKRKIQFTIIASGQNNINYQEFEPTLGKLNIIRAVTPKADESSISKFVVWSLREFFSLLVWMRIGFRGLNKTNSYFIVHGDTVSSLMGSLVCRIYGLKLVHIESGLRSYNFLEPFPEEICRFIISRLADIHFCPNEWCIHNLSSVSGTKINTEQNTLIETFWSAMKLKPKKLALEKIKTKGKKYFVLVSHRQEHVIFDKAGTQKILEYIFEHVPPGLVCLFVMHDLSASFINTLKEQLAPLQQGRIILTERLAYPEYMHMIKGSEFMITDGGSNQEEMYYMGKPCLLLRNTTERVEGLNENVLLSKNNKKEILYFLENYKKFVRSPVTIKKRPSKIIVDYLCGYAKK